MELYNSGSYLNDLKTAAEHAVGIEGLNHKSILITGATGTIGSFLADMLLEFNLQNHLKTKIILAGRNVQNLRKRFCRYVDRDFCETVSYDMHEVISWDFPVDYIVHAAGNAHPVAFNSDPVGTIMGNMESTFRLLEYGRNNGMKRLLYVSSGEVYGLGDLTLDFFREDYCGPLDNVSPRSCYPNSKRASETLCASYTKQYGVETVIVRPSHTYGPGITTSDSRAHVQFIRNVMNGEDIELKSAGIQVRSYTYAADVASAIVTVLMKGESGQAYNIANPIATVSIAGLADTIAKAEGKNVVFADPDATDLANRTPFAKQVLCSEKLEGLGWTGVFTVDEGVHHTITILKEGSLDK